MLASTKLPRISFFSRDDLVNLFVFAILQGDRYNIHSQLEHRKLLCTCTYIPILPSYVFLLGVVVATRYMYMIVYILGFTGQRFLGGGGLFLQRKK